MNTPDPVTPAEPQAVGGIGPGIEPSVSWRLAGSDTDEAEAVVRALVRDSVQGAALVPAPVVSPWSGTVIQPDPTTADDIAALVLAVPDVVHLHAGRFGEVATYLPGRRVTGVKLGDDGVEVHVVVAARAPIRQTAQLIHSAVEKLVAVPVHVYIEDVVLT